MSTPTKPCRHCAEPMPIGFLVCRSCGRDQDASQGAAPVARPAPAPDRSTCSRCGSRGGRRGHLSLRTGGSSGAAGLVFGQLAEAGERLVELATVTCPVCHHVDLYAR